MRLAKATRQNPRKLAEALVRMLPASPAVAKVEIAGAGFINFFLAKDAYHAEIGKVLRRGAPVRPVDGRAAADRCRWNSCRQIPRVRCTSATAGMPRSVRRSRICSRRWATRVEREYYINDAGRQMEILAVSTWLRYLEHAASASPFPRTAIAATTSPPSAKRLFAAEGAALRHGARRRSSRICRRTSRREAIRTCTSMRSLPARGRSSARPHSAACSIWRSADILGDIREDLREFGVTFDCWFSERSLSDDGSVERAIDALKKAGHAYVKDGALWFKSTDYGDEKDRVMVRENGVKTYFASDIAYVFNKLERGFDHLLYIWGADHHGYITRLRAGLVALGGPVGVLRGAPGAIRVAVPRRRKGADVDPLGRVRHLARLAQGSGQRRGAAVLRHAQQRSASGFRHGAGDLALERQPGVLHSVRARAGRERDAATAGARTRPRRSARPGCPWASWSSRRSCN